MKTFKLILLSTALASAGFAAQINSTSSDEVIELAPVVVEATRPVSPAQAGLNELKSLAARAPARVQVSSSLTAPSPARDGQRLVARAGTASRVAPVSFTKATARSANPAL